jgi:hypothetical protein
METAVAVGPTRSVARWTALAGAVYVVLFVIGTIVLFSGSPAGDASPAKVIQWYSDSGNRDQVNIGWLLIGLGIFFFLWFAATVRRAVMSVDGEGILTAVVGIGGSVYAAVAFASVALNAGIRTMSDDTFRVQGRHQVYPDLIHAANDAGYVMHATGAAALGAMIIAMSLAFMWAAVWPKWAGWLGVVVGILAIAAIIFFTQFLFLLWILVVSIVLFVRGVPTARAI